MVTLPRRLSVPQLRHHLHSALIVTALAFGLAQALSIDAAQAQTSKPGNMMSVEGRAETSVTPDLADVSAGVVSQAEDARLALSQNTEAMQKVMDGLKDMGIAEKDLQTSQFSVSPVYSDPRSSSGSRDITGYRVTNQVTARIRKIDDLGAVLDKLVTLGANQINNVSFSVSDPREVMDKLRKEAIADARAKADIYAEAANVTIVGVRSISEGGGGGGPQPVFARAMAMEASSVPVATGQQTLSMDVSLVYEIEDIASE